jgi:hypothetical protein
VSCGICTSLMLPHAITYDHSLPHERWHDHYLIEMLEARAKWPLINLIEVALRSRMSHQLELRFGTDFFVREPRQLMSGEISRLRLAQADSPVVDKFEVIRRLPMGFWLQLLSKKYESILWAPALWHSFPAWEGRSRRSIHEETTAVWRLRNQIAHHEPTSHNKSLPKASELSRLLLGLEPEFEPMVRALHPVESGHEQ